MESSDSDYKPPGDTKEIWSNTSKWRPIQLEILKVEFKDVEVEDIIDKTEEDLNKMDLGPSIDKILLPGIDIDTLPEDGPDDQIPFFNRLLQINTFTDEPPVDSIAFDLLNHIGFESRILHFRPRPQIKARWRDYYIASEADFGVFASRSRSLPLLLEYVLIVEYNPTTCSIYQNGECQLYGEMLLSAMVRHQLSKVDQIIYGIIFQGPYVRFYKVNFSSKYLSDIRSDRFPSLKVYPVRFPIESKHPLSLNVPNQRRMIIQLLNAIRIRIESFVRISII